MSARMSAAELAVRRHLLGLTLDELAEVLGVNRRTTRAWESGRDPIPERIGSEVAALLDAREPAVESLADRLDEGDVVEVARGDRAGVADVARALDRCDDPLSARLDWC